MDRPIRIVIADDHALMRSGIRRTIEEDSAFEVIAEAGDGEMALALILQHQPEIAVLDLDMPRMGGLEVARRVPALSTSTRIVFLTLHNDDDFLRAAMEVGGRGYLLKEGAIQEMLIGLHAVADGGIYVSPGVTTNVFERERLSKASPLDSIMGILTASERQILKLIGEGKSSKEIGAELSIHYRTVENHRTNICRKFGIEGANALVRFALQNRSYLDTRRTKS